MNQGIDNSLIGVLVVGLLVFLAGREVFCWYWKVNKALGLLTEIRGLLKLRTDSSPSA